MMKKIILLLISLLMFSCAGTRSVDKNKHSEKNSEKLESKSQSITNSEATTNQKSDVKAESIESSITENNVEEKAKNQSESDSQKDTSEKSSRTEKYTEYYENGNKKSEREVSESLSKMTAEKDFWKSNAESLKVENEKLTENSNAIYHENLQLVVDNKFLREDALQQISQIENSLEKSSKEMKRDFKSNWILMITIGFLLNWLLRFTWKKIKSAKWYIKLLEKLNELR